MDDKKDKVLLGYGAGDKIADSVRIVDRVGDCLSERNSRRRGYPRLMPSVYEDGQPKGNASEQEFVEYAASRWFALPENIR